MFPGEAKGKNAMIKRRIFEFISFGWSLLQANHLRASRINSPVLRLFFVAAFRIACARASRSSFTFHARVCTIKQNNLNVMQTMSFITLTYILMTRIYVILSRGFIKDILLSKLFCYIIYNL